MASICDLNNKKPKIDYPTHWEYKVIFDASDEAEAKVKDIVKDREFKLVFSKFSKDKKYASYDPVSYTHLKQDATRVIDKGVVFYRKVRYVL